MKSSSEKNDWQTNFDLLIMENECCHVYKLSHNKDKVTFVNIQTLFSTLF